MAVQPRRTITIKLVIPLPSLDLLLAGLANLIARYQIPIGSTRILVRRQMSLISVLACAMCIGLILTTNAVPSSSPLSPTEPWFALYAAMFLASGMFSTVYWFVFRRLSRTAEFYLRMASFTLAFTASLGWGALTALNVVVFSHEWVRVAPWVFISLYFGRALATYIEFIDLRAIEDLKQALHDT